MSDQPPIELPDNEEEEAVGSYAKSTLEQLRMRLRGGPCFLIACGSSHIRYYCGEQWCDNPNHARRYATQAQAEEVWRQMTTLENCRVEQHIW